jgi:hypothetical protein
LKSTSLANICSFLWQSKGDVKASRQKPCKRKSYVSAVQIIGHNVRATPHSALNERLRVQYDNADNSCAEYAASQFHLCRDVVHLVRASTAITLSHFICFSFIFAGIEGLTRC